VNEGASELVCSSAVAVFVLSQIHFLLEGGFGMGVVSYEDLRLEVCLLSALVLLED
jgi:hypothetical protein